MRWHTEAVCLLTAPLPPLPLLTYVFMMWKISWELQHRQNRWLLLLRCCGWSWSWSWERYSKMSCPHFIISTQGQPNEQACAHALIYSSPSSLLLCSPLATRASAGQTKLSLRTPHRRQLSNKTLINCFLAGVLWFLLTPLLPLLGQLEPSWELLCTN